LLDYRLLSAARLHLATYTRLFAGLPARCVTACVVAGLAIGFVSSSQAQATKATAIRKADLQIGGDFTLSPSPDYGTKSFYGGGGYATFDFTHSLGVEFNFRQLNGPNLGIYERTYQVGLRYVKHYGIVDPYVRGSYGRGVFNFPNDAANLAYNMFSVAAGVDVRVRRHVNVRADYEFQKWLSFPPNGLTPQVISLGAAYHF
jgi:hypothetical protein